ncbi:hypothetical protein E2C01_035304 [Portunus trituberculatus]|uniref:Uncharacterized protein n=1 Tax=Portunus trituberculatus TaxID=210409 RepID=A0A5B7F9E6_PORTR|nr:hypothetical protein [Portunus trituberculatus]
MVPGVHLYQVLQPTYKPPGTLFKRPLPLPVQCLQLSSLVFTVTGSTKMASDCEGL